MVNRLLNTAQKLCYHEAMGGSVHDNRLPFRLQVLVSAVRELGLQPLIQLASYRLKLRLGYLELATRSPKPRSHASDDLELAFLFPVPQKDQLLSLLDRRAVDQALSDADKVVAGQMRLFGGQLVKIRLQPPGELRHWTAYETGKISAFTEDVKFIWEPARLGWVFTLGRGYCLSGDERYPAAFWKLFEEFLAANPPYMGLNWVSAQEAGLRILALVFAWQLFQGSPQMTRERTARLAIAIADHAARIPPTLAYARAQNNNHLLSEAAGLFTAGLALPHHPRSGFWRKTGWRWFHRGLQSQIAADGAYIQHSVNYQRMVLQLSLWMHSLAVQTGRSFPPESLQRLRAATSWLGALIDRFDGRVPNLGPNDGGYIIPLSSSPFHDYRPVLQTAGRFFQGERMFDRGPWDEMSLWFGMTDFNHHSGGSIQASPPISAASFSDESARQTPHILHSPDGGSWAYLRAARFRGRPGHADQLHLDLWWRGLNLAQDAGTYLYNAAPPWKNALTAGEVHNTVTVDDQDQMLRVSRFLYLNWAQAKTEGVKRLDERSQMEMEARHTGYHRLGVAHQRKVTALIQNRWLVEDTLLSYPERSKPQEHLACLNWLILDGDWHCIEEYGHFHLSVTTPAGPVLLDLLVKSEADQPILTGLQIVRAGKLIYGSGPVKEIWGWASPTYGEKKPALAVRLSVRGMLPVRFISEWNLDRSWV